MPGSTPTRTWRPPGIAEEVLEVAWGTSAQIDFEKKLRRCAAPRAPIARVVDEDADRLV